MTGFHSDPNAASVARSLVGAFTTRGRVRSVSVMLVLLLAISVWVTRSADGYDGFLFVTFLTSAIGAIGLNLLMGTAGQVSIGNAAFLAVGAFTAVFMDRANVPFGLSVVAAALVSGVVGFVVGIPALRIRGIYLALATFAAHFIVLFAVERYQAATVGDVGFYLTPRVGVRGTDTGYWPMLLVGALALAIVVAGAAASGDSGRAMRFVRDHEGAAAALGVRVARAKLVIFSTSSAIVGFAGALAAYAAGTTSSTSFTLHLAITYLAMILIGGIDSEVGAVIGAAIVVWLPRLSSDYSPILLGESTAATYAPQVSQILYGVLIILCILASPNGIVGWFHDRRLLHRSRRRGVHDPALVAATVSSTVVSQPDTRSGDASHRTGGVLADQPTVHR
jgi:branched-chain amino acid transport system permease protein